MEDVTWQTWYIKVQYTIAQRCNSSNEHVDIVSKMASSRDLERKDHQTNRRIVVVLLWKENNIIRSPILNRIAVRAPILYQSMNMIVKAIVESSDVVAWILEEAVRKRQYQSNACDGSDTSNMRLDRIEWGFDLAGSKDSGNTKIRTVSKVG